MFSTYIAAHIQGIHSDCWLKTRTCRMWLCGSCCSLGPFLCSLPVLVWAEPQFSLFQFKRLIVECFHSKCINNYCYEIRTFYEIVPKAFFIWINFLDFFVVLSDPC